MNGIDDQNDDSEIEDAIGSFFGQPLDSKPQGRLTDTEALTSLASINNLALIFSIERLPLRTNPEVAIQALMVAMAADTSHSELVTFHSVIKTITWKVYYKILQAVIRTHKIDDFFDMGKDNFETWETFFQIFSGFLGYSALSDNQKQEIVLRVFTRTLELLSVNNKFFSSDGSYTHVSPREMLQLFKFINPELLVHQRTFVENLLMMLMAGHMFTMNKHYKEGKIVLPGKRQKYLMFNMVSLLPFTESSHLREVMYYYAINRPEIILSLYSSIQGFFEALENNPEFDTTRTALFDNLLGPLVFLSNWETEKVKNDIVFYDINDNPLPEANLEDWSMFIELSFLEIQKYIPETGVTVGSPFHKRLVQLCVGIQALNLSSTHNFINFPPALRDLSIIYNRIYDWVLGNSLCNVTEQMVKENLTVVATLEKNLANL